MHACRHTWKRSWQCPRRAPGKPPRTTQEGFPVPKAPFALRVLDATKFPVPEGVFALRVLDATKISQTNQTKFRPFNVTGGRV
eukprot:8938134-Pyramimonas_sp.AAC.1